MARIWNRAQHEPAKDLPMLAPLRQPPVTEQPGARDTLRLHTTPRARRAHSFASRAQARVTQLLQLAHVQINGPAATDIQVHNPRLYTRVLEHGSIGFGEAYMDGWWDAEDLDGLLFLLLDARLDERLAGIDDITLFLRAKLVNLQRGRRAWEVGSSHYDL